LAAGDGAEEALAATDMSTSLVHDAGNGAPTKSH
jgi:hypothetical protein